MQVERLCYSVSDAAIQLGKLECIAESPLNFRALSRLHALESIRVQIMDQLRVVTAICDRPTEPGNIQ